MISVHAFAMALCSKRCISKTVTLICMCGTQFESLLNGLIGGKLILRMGAISIQQARPIAIAEPLVLWLLQP